MEHNELRARRAARLSPAGRELLAEIERALEGPTPPDPASFIERIGALPPNDRAEIVSVVGGMGREFGARAAANQEQVAMMGEAAEIIREAQERDRAAGLPVDENMTLGEAIEKLRGASGTDELPDKVFAIGVTRDSDPAIHQTPIRGGEGGPGFVPLAVLDADGERAMPVFTTREKAERAIRQYMTEEGHALGPVASALVDLDGLILSLRRTSPGAPKVDYVGVDMGEGGRYAVLRP